MKSWGKDQKAWEKEASLIRCADERSEWTAQREVDQFRASPRRFQDRRLTAESRRAGNLVVRLSACGLAQELGLLVRSTLEHCRLASLVRSESLGDDDPGRDSRREGFAVERAERDHLERLHVASGPVVQDDEAENVVLGRGGREDLSGRRGLSDKGPLFTGGVSSRLLSPPMVTHNLKLPVKSLARPNLVLPLRRESPRLSLRANDLLLHRHGSSTAVVGHREGVPRGRQRRVGPEDGSAGAESVRGEHAVVDVVRDLEGQMSGVLGDHCLLLEVLVQGLGEKRLEGLANGRAGL